MKFIKKLNYFTLTLATSLSFFLITPCVQVMASSDSDWSTASEADSDDVVVSLDKTQKLLFPSTKKEVIVPGAKKKKHVKLDAMLQKQKAAIKKGQSAEIKKIINPIAAIKKGKSKVKPETKAPAASPKKTAPFIITPDTFRNRRGKLKKVTKETLKKHKEATVKHMKEEAIKRKSVPSIMGAVFAEKPGFAVHSSDEETSSSCNSSDDELFGGTAAWRKSSGTTKKVRKPKKPAAPKKPATSKPVATTDSKSSTMIAAGLGIVAAGLIGTLVYAEEGYDTDEEVASHMKRSSQPHTKKQSESISNIILEKDFQT